MPEKKVNLREVFDKAKTKGRATGRTQFVFQGKADKVPANDFRTLRRFAANQMYEGVHYSVKAMTALAQVVRFLEELHDMEHRMADSGLLVEAPEFRKSLEEQQKRIAVLKPILSSLAKDRARRIKEAVDMENELEREARRQRRAEEQKKAKKAKKKKAATQKLEPFEESGAPTLNLDPTLISKATQALTLDPENLQVNPKKAQKSEKPNTGR